MTTMSAASLTRANSPWNAPCEVLVQWVRQGSHAHNGSRHFRFCFKS